MGKYFYTLLKLEKIIKKPKETHKEGVLASHMFGFAFNESDMDPNEFFDTCSGYVKAKLIKIIDEILKTKKRYKKVKKIDKRQQ